MPPGVRRTATVLAGEAFLQALDNESPQADKAIMLDWLHNYTHSQDERSLDRRRNTVSEAAARLQSDVDRQDRGRERHQRIQRQALRNERRAEQAERERERARQRQVEREECDRQQREREEAELRLRQERDREQRENGPPLSPPIRQTIPIVLIPASTSFNVGNGAVQGDAGHGPDSTEARPRPRSRSRSRSQSQRQTQSLNGSSTTTVRQNQNTHSPRPQAITESATQREQEGDGNLYPSLPSNPHFPGSYQHPIVEEEVVDEHDDYQPPPHEPSPAPEPHSPGQRPSHSHPERGSRHEQGERQDGVGAGVGGGDGAAENVTTQDDTANNGSADNAAGTQVPRERDTALQPDNNDPRQDDPSPVELAHVIDVEIPKPPLRLGASTDEPPPMDTLNAVVQLLEIQIGRGQFKQAVKLLLELVLSWFKPAPYKALGESMAYIIDHTSISEIPKDHGHEPTPGHSLSGKRFEGDVPESLQRLRDRWNHTRSTQCLANRFWQNVKFRLSAMDLFLHWEHLQDTYSSKKPKFAAEQAYLQRLVNSIPGNTQGSGRRDAARLKIAIAPYLGIGLNDGGDTFWQYTMTLGSRAAVFQEHWGLLALVGTKRYCPTTFTHFFTLIRYAIAVFLTFSIHTRLMNIPLPLLTPTIPLLLARHPSLRDISLAIYWNYIQPLWSDGSLSPRCRDFATALTHGDTHIINACQANPIGAIGLFGYSEPGQVLVPEMSGALTSTPPPPQGQGGPPTPPPTRERSGFDDGDVVRDVMCDDTGPNNRDVLSESSEEDRSSDDNDDGQDRIVRSSPHPRTRLHLQSRSPTPSAGSRAKRRRT
ncbi:MAG: hypothetical protein Q9208_005768 [Pyrenodesmia sp. 3 TL-2023]